MADKTPEARAKRERIWTARRSAEICGCCGKALSPQEPVWRVRQGLGQTMFGGWSYTIIPICHDCTDSYYIGIGRTAPCEACGRPVTNKEQSSWRHLHWFCSERCQAKCYRLAQRAKTAEQRNKICPVCQTPFEAKRTDARTCSSACRQKGYRARVTDRRCPASTPT